MRPADSDFSSPVRSQPARRGQPAQWKQWLLTFVLTWLVSATIQAQVIQPDESLTDGPATDVVDSTGAVTPQINRETINAASPTRVLGDTSILGEPVRRGLFRRKQQDSTFVDTAGINFFKKVFSPVFPNPERAAALSFVLPGAGQIYNRRFAYIKVPVIYAGYGALIYSGQTNLKQRERYATALGLQAQGLPHEFTDTRFDQPNALRTQRDQFDKNYQLSYIGVGILHLVQMLEAYTTAHLLDFDIDENLSMGPQVYQPGLAGFGESSNAAMSADLLKPRLAFRVSYRFQ